MKNKINRLRGICEDEIDCCHENSQYINGVSTCLDCGFVDEEDISLSHRIIFPKPINSGSAFYKPKGTYLQPELKKILNLNSRISGEENNKELHERLGDLLMEFDLSDNQKISIKNFIKEKKVKTMKGVITLFLRYVINLELPIPNKKIWEVLKNYYFGKEIYRKFRYIRRDYSWYISQLLSKFDFLSVIMKAYIYSKARDHYKNVIIKFSGLDPLCVIGSYCYHIISNICKDVPKEKRSIGHFGISGTTYRNYKERGIYKDG